MDPYPVKEDFIETVYPEGDVHFNKMVEMDGDSMQTQCQLNKFARKFCDKDNVDFWRTKYRYFVRGSGLDKPLTWKQLWVNLYTDVEEDGNEYIRKALKKDDPSILIMLESKFNVNLKHELKNIFKYNTIIHKNVSEYLLSNVFTTSKEMKKYLLPNVSAKQRKMIKDRMGIKDERIGMRVDYQTPNHDRMTGEIINVYPKTARIRTDNGEVISIPHSVLEEYADVYPKEKEEEKPRIGMKVKFRADSPGKLTGIIIKVHPKRAEIQLDDGQIYLITYSKLEYLEEEAKKEIIIPTTLIYQV